MIKAIGYIRRSTDKQEESLSQQREKLKEFSSAQGWHLVEIFEDDAISGSQMDRPGLLAMMQRATTDEAVNVVIAWDRNRIARPKDPVEGMLLERQLIKSGKRVVYAATGQEAERSFTSDLIGLVEHHQNGDYLRKLSRDTMRGLVSRAQRGLWTGGPIPWGYDRLILNEDGTPNRIVRDQCDGSQVVLNAKGEFVEQVPKGRQHKKQDHELTTLIPSEPERVRAVQKIFADFAAGLPTRTIRDSLNQAGFRTTRGAMFSHQSLIPMLENAAYIGRCEFNRRTESKWHRHTQGKSSERVDEGIEYRPASDWVIKDDAWPAIVEREVFEQAKNRRRDSKARHRQATGKASQTPNILTGLFHCAVCGGRLSGIRYKNARGYETRQYVCQTHHNGQHHRCPKRYTVPAKVVEAYVVNLILSEMAKLRDDQDLHRTIEQEMARQRGGNVDAVTQLQKQLAQLDQKSAKLRDHLLSLDPETAEQLGLYNQAKSLSAERSAIEKELDKSHTRLPDLPDAATIRERASALFDHLQQVFEDGPVEQKRELTSLFIKRIEADPTVNSVKISLYPSLFNSGIAGSRVVYQ